MTKITALPLSPAERLNLIPQSGLCIGCGLCQSVAGPDRVRVVKTTRGDERPVVIGDLDHETVDRIYDTCPGTRIEGLPDDLVDDDTASDPVWGSWRRMVKAYASDAEIRHVAATGGVMSALGVYLLESKRVDFILHARASEANPTFGERHLSFDRAGVIEGAGSRYGPTAPLLDFREILDRGQPFAFFGKPCDVTAVRNYARHDPRTNALCRYTIVPVCGGYMPTQDMRNFLQARNIDFDDLTAFRYRGFGCPGVHRMEMKDGKVHEIDYHDFWGGDESTWSMPFRCKICPDAIGEAADIAASDTWPGGGPTLEGQKTDLGTNGVIARTKAGEALLADAIRDGVLTADGSIGPDEMTDYQPHQVSKKRAVWARLAGLKAAGQLTPDVERLRIRELALDAGYEANLREARGSRVRAHAGKASEPVPEPHEPL